LPIMGCMMITIINADTLILRQFSQSTGTAAAVIGTLRFGSGALAGPVLAFFYDSTALPFALMMAVSVLSVGIVHFTLSPAKRGS
jgi:MFS transporter, DHA1 family, multidrug resistance protein